MITILEAVSTSETSNNIYETTRRTIQEDLYSAKVYVNGLLYKYHI
jgi:hypothetical protein